MLISLLDNDLYKFTMQNAVIKIFPRSRVRYQFINRGKTAFPGGFGKALQKEVNMLAYLELSPEEKQFLTNICYYLDPTYIDFLAGYRYDPNEVHISQDGGDLHITIEGYWYRTILWEVPLMAMISELYFQITGQESQPESQVIETIRNKANRFYDKGASVIEFGTRRRYSFANHDLVVRELKNVGKTSFIGTSNLFFAQKYKLTPMGTHAHEWFMFHAAQFGFKMANLLSLQNWVDVYKGSLGIALSDTFTTDAFFMSFNKQFAKLFDGVRQDSGNPFEFAEKTIAHYRMLGIDPASKTIVFSDALDPDTVEKLFDYCKGRIRTSFGIGTNLTNDVGVKPLNMVIKLTEAEVHTNHWVHTVKLSDVEGKYTGNSQQIEICKEELKLT